MLLWGEGCHQEEERKRVENAAVLQLLLYKYYMSTAILCATLCSRSMEEEVRGCTMMCHSLSLMETTDEYNNIPLPSAAGNGPRELLPPQQQKQNPEQLQQ